jgi:hypothetical protein
MRRRSRLIYLCSLNAILASAVVALVTIVLAGGGSAQRTALCGGADGPATRDGFIPVNDSFDSVTAAERFICHSVAYPRSTPGWDIEHIGASRSGPAAYVGRGLGFASVTLDYMQPDNPAADLRIEVSPYHIDPVSYGIVDEVEIMGSPAKLIEGVDRTHNVMQWEAEGFSFYVEARLTDGFGLPELYKVLNSIR